MMKCNCFSDPIGRKKKEKVRIDWNMDQVKFAVLLIFGAFDVLAVTFFCSILG